MISATARVIHWRGPSPFYFAELPGDASDRVRGVAPGVSYGWGAIQAVATAQGHTWTTAIFPRDGRYLVPLKKSVRQHVTATVGESVDLLLSIPGSDLA